MTSVDGFAGATAPPSAAARSPWHSPVPYLFGGLAAMLGLIAFALLLLACSYWRLSGYLENDGNENNDSVDIEAGGGGAPPVFDEKLLVIMAGQVKPTFLATAVAFRTSSFGSSSSSSSTQSSESCTAGGEDQEKE
ncbi:unnamed protein product [Cuscuta campestris]|uniref:Protein GLUTAMINE DUMPER 3 n=1 Tax=Cuscuta campestris TaxID=132261 RepID=A0A484LEY9_9ASTE|nr:unnamed protein product [Cuscuta campestris]